MRRPFPTWVLSLACLLAASGEAVLCAPPVRVSEREAPGAGTLDAQNLLSAVLRRHAAYHDFQARFTETSISRATGPGTTESGIVSYLRPDNWRWEYLSPERKLVVVRDRLATISFAGDPEVSRYDLGEGARGSGIGLLLAGGGNLGETFVARFEPPGSPPGTDQAMLRLNPVEMTDEYDHVLIRVNRRTLTILEAIVVDPGGNRLRFQFEAFRADRGLGKALFTVPPATSGKP